MVTHRLHYYISLFQNEVSSHGRMCHCDNVTDLKINLRFGNWSTSILRFTFITLRSLSCSRSCNEPKITKIHIPIDATANLQHFIYSWICYFKCMHTYLCMLLCIQSNNAREMDIPWSFQMSGVCVKKEIEFDWITFWHTLVWNDFNFYLSNGSIQKKVILRRKVTKLNRTKQDRIG